MSNFWFMSWFWIVVASLLLAMMAWLRERRLRGGQGAERLVNRRHQQQIDHQINLGNRVYNAIKVACDQNRLVRFRIDREQNDSTFGYFIVVRLVDDPKRALGKKMLDISIKFDTPEDEQVEVWWAGRHNHEFGYKMSVRRFENGPELQILTDRLKVYVPAVSMM